MGTVDPAWFYSSLAQVCAAIVGLIGAILGSRLIDYIARMREAQSEVERIVGSYYATLRERLSHFARWKTIWEQELEADRSALKRGETRRQGVTLEWGGSEKRGEIDVEKHARSVELDLLLLTRILAAYRTLPSGEVDDASVRTGADKLSASVRGGHSEWARFTVEYEARELTDRVDKYFRPFRAKLVPRSFVVILGLLAWLTLTGIIWPLAALPGLPDRFPKAWMLGALGIGLFGLMAYFGYQLWELWRLRRIKTPVISTP